MTARRARPSSSVRLFYKRLSDVWDADFAEALEDTGDKKYARVTQILGLLDLHPRIREHVKAGRDFATLRRLVALLPLPPREQLVQAARLLPGFRVRRPKSA